MLPDDDKTRSHVTLARGTMVSHYRIVEKLGEGGMGEVYLAEDTKLNRKVALKFLPLHSSQNADHRARFTREAQAAAKLNHSNIITIYEVSEFEGRPFFAMEHLEGQSLSEYVKVRKPSWQELIGLAIQVVEGLGEAHRSGVVHRDIKPSNILVDERGKAKILDFGLAAIKGEKKLTKTGSTLGTLHYMSPEQTRGELLDERSDIFSFGVVFYEMITGQTPFRGDHEPAIMYSIAYDEPEPLARYKSGVSEECQRIVSKALAKEKAVRYQHADELSADLKRLISTVSAAPIQAKRKRRVLVPALVLLGVVVAVLVTKPWRLMMKPSEEATAPKRVAIVPFKNQTGDPSLDPLGKIVADWTIQGVMGTGRVEVVPLEALLGLDTGNGVRSVAEATGATVIATGTYYKIGDSIQFQAQVSDEDARLLQTVEPVYASVNKVMDGVEAVRQRVLGALMLTIDTMWTSAQWAKVSKPPTYEAYVQCMQGLELQLKHDWAGSIPYFERAYALDSTFLLPLAGICFGHMSLGQNARADSVLRILEPRRSELLPALQLEVERYRARVAGDWMGHLVAIRAQTKLLAPPAGNPNWGLAALWVNHPAEAVEALKKCDPERNPMDFWNIFASAYHLSDEHEKELEAAREGRRRYPTDAVIYNAELEALAAMGRITDLRKVIDDRPAFDPQSSTPAGSMRAAAIELRAHGHEEEAMRLLDEAIQWYERQPAARLDSLKGEYANALYWARRWDKAKVVYEELAQGDPKDPGFATWLGLLAARQGDTAKAMEVSEWLKNLQLPYRFGADTYNRACIAAILGDKEQAVALLKESFLHGQQFSNWIHQDFDLESLWDYPPFIEFLKPKG